MPEYIAMLALPDGETALEAAARIPGAEAVDNESAGVWVTWTVEAADDKEAIALIQEIRLRAEMSTGTDSAPEGFTLFLATPFIILRGKASVIHTEEVICI